MPFLWSALSSSSSSSANRPLKGKSKSSNDIFKNTGSKEQKRKLTRQRKLRYATDDELGLKSGVTRDGSESWPVSPDSGSGTVSGPRTPHHAGGCHWSKSAVPLPLPRPGMNYQVGQCDGSHGPRAGVVDPPGSAVTRNISDHKFGKTTDDIIQKRHISPTYRRRGFPRDLNVDTADNNFCLHFPARSAPSSGYSSPLLSPQRYSTVDLFHPSFQVSSALEFPTSDRILKSHQITRIPTPEHSPLYSPMSQIKGQWQRGRPIGRGTYGSVYIATHRETGATCAMKEVEMIPDDPKCAECIKQLKQEIKFLRELKHPNIVQYYGYDIIEDRFCIYLEYVHPGSITKYVREHCGAMTESIVRNFTRHIVSGLAYLHSSKTIHRDIKGANLLVDASGVVKLADFGLAKHLMGHDFDLSLKGTPHWMAPEVLQAAMRKDGNPEMAYGVDIWSLGCTVIEMLTGRPPWSEYNGVQAMFNILNRAPPIPETLSAEGKDFLHWCFQRQPADRPSAAELLEHPFLRSSQDQNLAGFVQDFSGLKLYDVEFPTVWSRQNKDVMPLSSVTRIQQGKTPVHNGETSRQSCPESPDLVATSHQSPRSTLEALPCKSSPERNRSSNGISPSNVQNNLLLRAVNNSVSSFSCKGNLTLLMPERKKRSCNVQEETNQQ
ncbi:mitogen-activated protein kinase kinase kinase 5-like [Sesamum indicum]|uniref:mitogen-activated protein kinase kinase kinase n=1 Tax=Sesamum indicum TaxID=4182 RepID=A0A6I9TG70_SESIN|nr:mitogen-activated protein kinase kinase kinase 5-like [Sesamum indicum]